MRLALAFLRLHAGLIAALIGLGVAISSGYVLLAASQYTATSTLLIDDSKFEIFQRGQNYADPQTESALLETQIEVIKSLDVAREVIRLLGEPAITVKQEPPVREWLLERGLHPSQWLDNVKSRLGLSSPGDDPGAPLNKLARNVSDLITIKRTGLTYAVTISVTADTAEKAQAIANAVPLAYVNVDQAAKLESSRKTVRWLDERLRELRDKLTDADLAVENFRRDRNPNTQDRGLVNTQLRQLESTSLSYKTLLDNVQTRYLQAVTEEGFQVSKARVISEALLPEGRSSPRLILALPMGAILGFLLGCVVGIIRDILKGNVQTATELAQATRTPCLAVLENLQPKLGGRGWRLPFGKGRANELDFRRVATELPLSHYSQEMRRIGLSLRQRFDKRSKGSVIGIVSLFPNEGKSTVASNLAHSLGQMGSKIALVDFDLLNPSLSRAYEPPRDALTLQEAMRQLRPLWQEPSKNFDFLPAATFNNSPSSLASFSLSEHQRLEQLFDKLRTNYDLIVLDLPPIRAVADADAVKHLFDACVLVTRSGRCSFEVLRETTDRFDPMHDKITGSILNGAAVTVFTDYQYESSAAS